MCWVQQTCFHSLSGLLWGGSGGKEKEKQPICLTPALSPPIVDHPYVLHQKYWYDHQLGVLAYSCDSAAGELELWIAVGWDTPDEAGHVELVSALSLVSTWAPPGSRRWPGGLMSQEPGQVGHRATQSCRMRQ